MADAATIVPGTTVAWTIDVTNAGPSVARARDASPTPCPTASRRSRPAWSVGVDDDPCAVAGAIVTCAIGDLAPGTPVRIDLTGAVGQDAAGRHAEQHGQR